MPDVVVTCPKSRWAEWIAEGDLPGDRDTGQLYGFELGGAAPDIEPGERVYVVAYGRLRGYAPLIELRHLPGRRWTLIRGGGAVAVTIPEPVIGFMGRRYRWWDRRVEVPFPNWREPHGAAPLPTAGGTA